MLVSVFVSIGGELTVCVYQNERRISGQFSPLHPMSVLARMKTCMSSQNLETDGEGVELRFQNCLWFGDGV